MTPTELPQLHWHKHGPSDTAGRRTYWREHASVTDFTFIPGFTNLSEVLGKAGFGFSKRLSVGYFERIVEAEFTTPPFEERATSYSFFASIRFIKKLDTGTLILHRTARGKESESLATLTRILELDSRQSASLTWENEPELTAGSTRTSLMSLALFVYGLAHPIADHFGTVEIHYRRSPTKRQPDGNNALFSVGTDKLTDFRQKST